MNPITPHECNPFRENPAYTLYTQELWNPPDLHSVTGITRIETVIGIGFMGIGSGYNYHVMPPMGYVVVKTIHLRELWNYPNALQKMRQLIRKTREAITDVIKGTAYSEGYFILYGKRQPQITDYFR